MEVLVNGANKYKRAVPADGAQHEEEEVTDGGHVAEKEAALEETRHLGAIHVVEDRVDEDEEAG